MSFSPDGTSTPIYPKLADLAKLTANHGANKAEADYAAFHRANGVVPRRRAQRYGLILRSTR